MSRSAFAITILFALCLSTAPLPAQTWSTIVFYGDKPIAGYVAAVRNDSIQFIPSQNAVSPAAMQVPPAVMYARRDIRQIRYGGDAFDGTGLLAGALLGSGVGLIMKLSLDRDQDETYQKKLSGTLAFITCATIGTLSGALIEAGSSTPDMVLHPCQERDYRILGACVAKQETLNKTSLTSQRVWSLANALLPRLTVVAADRSQRDVYLLALGDRQALLLRYDWVEAINSGEEAEYFFRYEDIISISHAPPGIFGGSGWTWKPTEGKPDDLHPHALRSKYATVLDYAPCQVR